MLVSQDSKVSFVEVPLGSGGAAVAAAAAGGRGGRQCAACPARARPAQPAAAPPAPLARLSETDFDLPMMTSKRDDELEDRDPNNLNSHVQIVWDDIFGEPAGARSPECAWRLSRSCFTRARDGCYTALGVLLAPPCALLLGCCFACLAFEQIWCTAPCIRCVKIYLSSARTVVSALAAAYVVPAADALGHLCRHIRVNLRRDAPEERDLLVI